MAIPIETLSHVRALYDRALYLQAYQTAIAAAPLSQWQDTEARVLAGRVAMQVGGQRWGTACHLRAWRRDSQSPVAAYYYASALLSRRGLLAAWDFVRTIPDWVEASDRERAQWWGLRAQLLSYFRDFDAAGEWLEKAIALDPDDYWLYVVRAWLLESEAFLTAEAVLRHMAAIDQIDGWTRRQLARVLGKQGRFPEAFTELDAARELEDRHPNERYWRGYLHQLSGDIPAAKAAYKEALQLSIDTDGAIASLLNLCYSREERLAALDFIFEELKQQVTLGDALTAYQSQAASDLDPETLLAQLQEAQAARPDLWQAWSALTLQLLQLDRLDEALNLAQSFAQQFPLLPKAWLDLSTVCRQRGDADSETNALQQALAIEPTWDIAIGRLSRIYQRADRLDLAEELLL